MNVNTTE